MLCELLRGALRRRRAFRVVGCEVTVREFLATAQNETIDVVLVGAHLQDGTGSGLHAIQLLRAARPDVRAIVLLQRFETNLVAESFRVGARGVFFRSQHHLDVLLKCISRVHAGQIWASTSDLEQMVEALAKVAGKAAAERVRWVPDQRIRAIVKTWPVKFRTPRALAMGFKPDEDVESVIRSYAADEGIPL